MLKALKYNIKDKTYVYIFFLRSIFSLTRSHSEICRMSITSLVKSLGILPWGLLMKISAIGLKLQVGMEEKMGGTGI